MHGLVEQGERDAHHHGRPRRGLGEQRQVAAQRRALGQDRERRRRPGERLDDPRHQPVAALGPLVGIGVRAERDGLAAPRRPGDLTGQHLGDVDLDHDLGVEVGPGVQVEVGVRLPGEAVDAPVRAAAVGVDRPAERHVRRGGHVVQRRARQHLVERDPRELGRPHRPDEPGHLLHPRQRVRVRHHPADRLPRPPHDSHENTRSIRAPPRAAASRTPGSARRYLTPDVPDRSRPALSGVSVSLRRGAVASGAGVLRAAELHVHRLGGAAVADVRDGHRGARARSSGSRR